MALTLYYHDVFTFPLPRGHRFPAAKYRLLRAALLDRGIARPEDLHLPPAATYAERADAHTPAYLDKGFHGRLSPAEVRRIGLPWSPALLERTRRSVGSTLMAAQAALAQGLAANLGGGTHHAGPDWGAGYCVFNDVGVAARLLLAQGRVRRVMVIDTDVHQGDGTAAIAASEPRLFAFSIHAQRNFPFRKVPGDLDLGLPDGTDDAAYQAALARGLRIAYARFGPPGLVFYIAGADPWQGDRLGRLGLTKAGLEARDRLVLNTVYAWGAPLVVVLGGGYAPDLRDTVDIHARTLALAAAWTSRFAAWATLQTPTARGTLGEEPHGPANAAGREG